MVYNVTGIEVVDYARTLLEGQLLGGTAMALLFLMGLIIVFLLMIDARKEVLWLLPAPLIWAISDFAGLQWLKVVLALGVGFYIWTVFRAFGGSQSR